MSRYTRNDGPQRVASGLRDRSVEVQALAESTTPGFPVETWTSLRTVQAAKTDISQVERFTSDQNSAPCDTRWSLPYSADYDPELVDVSKQRRLVYRGRIYDVVSALMVGRRSGVELMTLSGGML